MKDNKAENPEIVAGVLLESVSSVPYIAAVISMETQQAPSARFPGDCSYFPGLFTALEVRMVFQSRQMCLL